MGIPHVLIHHSGAAAGYWHPGSLWKWYSALVPATLSGAYDPTNGLGISDFVWAYSQTDAPYGSTDTITLTMHDLVDDICADTSYTTHFHFDYEAWTRTQIVAHPVGSPPLGGEWFLLTTLTNPGPTATPMAVSNSYAVEDSETGEFSAGQTLTPAGILAFAWNEKIAVGHKVTVTIGNNVTFSVPPYTVCQVWAGETVLETWGTTSMWGHNGYAGDTGFHGRKPSGLLSLWPIYSTMPGH